MLFIIMKYTKTKIIRFIAFPAAIIHELCHYLMATLLGVKANFDLTQTTFSAKTSSWKVLLITLAPPIAGFIFCLLMLGVVVQLDKPILPTALTLFSMVLLWQLPCLQDWREVWYFLQNGTWQNNELFLKQWPPSDFPLSNQQISKIDSQRTKRNYKN